MAAKSVSVSNFRSPTGTVEEKYSQLQSMMADNIVKSTNSHLADLGELQQIDAEFDLWTNYMLNHDIRQFFIARREFAMANYCASSGMYRQAYSSLRVFLELSFATVYFSAHEFDRRRWEKGKLDYSWRLGLDEQSGVLSKEFVEVFQNGLVNHAMDFAKKASNSYRCCSEYIHGKATMSRLLPEGLQYEKRVLEDWIGHAKDAGEAVLFLLLVRYGDKTMEDPEILEVVAERFGFLSGVRELIGLAND